MVSLVRKKRGNPGRSAGDIVERELRKQKEAEPVVLLVVAINAEVLFQGLVSALCLSVSFGMISRSKVKLHVKSFPKRSEEMRHKLNASVGGNMRRDSVLRKHVEYEELR